VVNAPTPEPVAGQPFEPYCRFDLCTVDEPHAPECKSRGDRDLQFKHEEPKRRERTF
jgi:hypothetical protein